MNRTESFSVDVKGFEPQATLPDLLLPKMSVVAGTVEGDAPSLVVPFLDPTADLYAEGAEIAESEDVFSEVEIKTHKTATLVTVSNELKRNASDSGLPDSMLAAVTNRANAAFLGNAGDPAGILNDASITDGGTLGADLDSVYAALWGIAESGVNADYIAAAPSAMAALSALKTGTGSNQSLVADPVLAGLPVIVTAAMPANSIVVGSKSAVVSALGDLLLAQSDHHAFSRDGHSYRVTLRSGWKLARPDRLVKISTTA